MPRTADEIIEQSSQAYNVGRQSTGFLSRIDLAEYISTLTPDADKRQAVSDFLDKCTYLTAEDRTKTLNDLPSYGIV
jgi:hypothetical protein